MADYVDLTKNVIHVYSRLFGHRAAIQGDLSQMKKFDSFNPEVQITEMQNRMSKVSNELQISEKHLAENLEQILSKVNSNKHMIEAILINQGKNTKEVVIAKQQQIRKAEFDSFCEMLCEKKELLDDEYSRKMESLKQHYVNIDPTNHQKD